MVSNNQNNIQSLKNNSLNGKPVHKKNIKKEKVQKDILKSKFVQLTVCMSLVAGSLLVTANAISNSPTNIINEYVNDNDLNIVSRNTYRTNDNKNYYYSHQQIAQEILKSDNQEFLIYICFREMDSRTAEKYGNQEIRNMNDVFEELNRQSENDSIYRSYDSFKDYLIKNGYSNSDGEPDYELYDKYMQERLIRIIQNEKKEKSY